MRAFGIAFMLGWAIAFGVAFSAEPINIPDSNLKAAIEDQLGSDPSEADMLGLRSLVATNVQVETLTGLEYAENLRELDLGDNNLIKDLSPLQGLVNLRELMLNDNNITNIEPLANMAALEVLNLIGNQVEDITVLSSLGNLTQVGLTDNNIHDIQPLSNLDRLFVILIDENPLSARAYDTWIPLIKENNPDLYFVYDPSPYVETVGKIVFDDADEFIDKVSVNAPDEMLVEHVEERQIMRMYPRTGGTTRVKLRMGAIEIEEVWVQVDYKFISPDTQLHLFVSDTEDFDDSAGQNHVEAGTILPPLGDNPGAVGSDHFGLFEKMVDVRSLDSENGLWLELSLDESEPILASVGKLTAFAEFPIVDINEASVETRCQGICMDWDGDNGVQEEDFLFSLKGCGFGISSEAKNKNDPYELGGAMCIDTGGFSQDHYVDALDLKHDDWRSRSSDLNLCGQLELTNREAKTTPNTKSLRQIRKLIPHQEISLTGPSVIVMGKPSESIPGIEERTLKREYLLYAFGIDYQYKQDARLEGLAEYCNIRTTKDSADEIYIINSQEGIIGLDGVPLITPQIKNSEDSRIIVGIQESGGHHWGRPILDASIKGDSVFVVPVVVHPNNNPENDGYLAAAELSPLGDGDFTILRTFFDANSLRKLPEEPNLTGLRQSPNLMGLREIEVDEDGNVYVLNVHRENNSSLLWKYDHNGDLISQRFLNRYDPNNPTIPHPMGLCYSHDTIYVASGARHLSNRNRAAVYGLDAGTLDVTRVVTITNMYHITDIAGGPDGIVLVSGFTIGSGETPFPEARLARIPIGRDDVEATGRLFEPMPQSCLSLPMSIMWIRN